MFLLAATIRDMTPDGCFSVMGVDTGVTGTDLLVVGRPLPGVGITPVTAVDSLSTVVEEPLVISCRPGIGRAGGATVSHTKHSFIHYALIKQEIIHS